MVETPPLCMSMAMSFHNAVIKKELWERWWLTDSAGKYYKKHHPKLKGKGFPQEARGLARRQQILLTRIRLGNCVQGRYLRRIGSSAVEDSLCPHCGREDSTIHRILICGKYLHQRRSLARDLREKHSAIDPEFVFPVFAEAATAGDRKAAYMRFMKFLEDTELDTLFVYKQAENGIT